MEERVCWCETTQNQRGNVFGSRFSSSHQHLIGALSHVVHSVRQKQTCEQLKPEPLPLWGGGWVELRAAFLHLTDLWFTSSFAFDLLEGLDGFFALGVLLRLFLDGRRAVGLRPTSPLLGQQLRVDPRQNPPVRYGHPPQELVDGHRNVTDLLISHIRSDCCRQSAVNTCET